MWVDTSDPPTSDGHPYFERLNRVLADSGFDAFVEELCATFYADRLGRPSLRPGRYFRMLFIGYFEGLSSERGIAWRVADSLSLRSFLGSGVDRGGAGPLDAVAHAAADRRGDPRGGVHSVRSTRAFSCALPMYSTPSPPDHCRRYSCVRSSLRSPRRNDTTSMPLRSA